jgi:hypothetical protein
MGPTDQLVLEAVGQILQRIAVSNCIRPAQLVSIAKVQHVLSKLPRVAEDVCVTVSLSWSVNQDGNRGSSGWTFTAADGDLSLSCGGSEYTEGVGSDSFTTMSWSAYPGRETDYDGSWDSEWMGSQEPGALDACTGFPLGECHISIHDEDNALLSDDDERDDDGGVDPPEDD